MVENDDDGLRKLAMQRIRDQAFECAERGISASEICGEPFFTAHEVPTGGLRVFLEKQTRGRSEAK